MDGPLRYSDAVLDHYRNPRNVGEIQGSAAVAQAGDPATGDVLCLCPPLSTPTEILEKIPQILRDSIIAATN